MLSTFFTRKSNYLSAVQAFSFITFELDYIFYAIIVIKSIKQSDGQLPLISQTDKTIKDGEVERLDFQLT